MTGPGGPREDRVLARLSPGEFVVNAEAHARHPQLVRAINDGTLPAYADGGAVGALAAATAGRPADPAATARLEQTIAAGVKEGVVSGLREARDMAGTAATGRAVQSSIDAGGGGEFGGEGGSGHANLRYGRAGSGAPNLRYGSAGGRARGTPAARAHGVYRDTPGGSFGGAVPGANGYGTIDAPYRAPVDAKGEGGQLSPRDLFGYLKGRGATDNEATMLTGAAGNESSFNPRAVHDGGHGHGLWGHNDARIDMRGKTWQQQADLALDEVKKHYAGRVNAAKTPEELADAEMHYERPRGYHANNPRGGDNYTGRTNTLRRFGNEFGTMKSGAPGVGSPGVANAERPAAGDGQFPDWMNDRSRRELSAVNGDLARDLLAASKETGIHFNVAQGLRYQAEANRNAASGRGVRDSQHLYGAAADLHMLDAQGRETYDRAAYQRFGDAFERIQHQHGGAGRWLGNLPGRWGQDIVHFDQGIGYGQTHARSPYGSARPTHDDVVAGNLDAYRSPMNPFTGGGKPPLSPRFTDPGLRRVYEAGAGGATGGGQAPGRAGPPAVVHQNFYGQHDPRETALHARRESNREIRRAQARALHGVGRPA